MTKKRMCECGHELDLHQFAFTKGMCECYRCNCKEYKEVEQNGKKENG